MNKRMFLTLWVIDAVFFLLYSFTQIDLSLTMSRLSVWQSLQKSFQSVGYFNRSLSTDIFVFLVVVSGILYLATLLAVSKNRISRKTIWMILSIVSGILVFSYNAFSYDLFNYIFDARIFTHYHLNPYQYRALDFYKDPMLSFMHSIDRRYPYGPTWLFLTIPLSFLGSQIFLPTFYLFKILAAASFLGTCWAIEKILVFFKPINPLLGLVFFALNPLIIIESLVSGHNDIAMLALGTLSLYFLLKQNYIVFVILFVGSIGIKFATIFLLPVFVFVIILRIFKKSFSLSILGYSSIVCMLIATIVESAAGGPKTPEPQPWYLINVLPFAALVVPEKFVSVITIVVSIGMLCFYIPFLANGVWPKDIVTIKLWITGISFVVGIFLVLLFPFVYKNFISRDR